MGIYDISVTDRSGKEISLSEFKGKVLLIVNTATQCGFTPQYQPLQGLYDELHDKGLEILDFPCNQFGSQAPGSDDEIHTFCTGRFGITFPQYAKIDVNGENASDLYKYLTANTVYQGFEGPMASMMEDIAGKMDADFRNNGNIKWNFTKFVIDKNGNIAKRFEPTADMCDVKACIMSLLK